MSSPPYSDVVDALLKADVPIRQLQGPGNVAVTLAAGRIVAMSFSPGDTNLSWSNTELLDTHLVRSHPERLVGGFGGDRLWFGPEIAYHWKGPPRWDTFANYQVPDAADPGNYQFLEASQRAVTLCATGQLTDQGTHGRIGFEVERTIRLIPPPLPHNDPLMKGIRYVGVRSSHLLKLDPATSAGRIGLWHLLQIPVGSVLIVPLKDTALAQNKVPLSYGLPGEWLEKSDHIRWQYTGTANAKFGLSASALTGRSAVLRQLKAEQFCLIIRQFPVDEKATYADHPYGVPRADQAFQAWDGLGFGEMEFHGPALDAVLGPRELVEADDLWAFGGLQGAILRLARNLLGVDITDILEGL
jgi:hypothetical protein